VLNYIHTYLINRRNYTSIYLSNSLSKVWAYVFEEYMRDNNNVVPSQWTFKGCERGYSRHFVLTLQQSILNTTHCEKVSYDCLVLFRKKTCYISVYHLFICLFVIRRVFVNLYNFEDKYTSCRSAIFYIAPKKMSINYFLSKTTT